MLANERGGQLVRALPCRAGRPLRVLVPVGQHGQLRVRRELKSLAKGQVGAVEPLVVAGRGEPEAVVVWIRGLDHDACPGADPARPAGGLGDQRKRVLCRTVVREVEGQVGVHDPYHAHGLEIEALGDQLRPDQDVRPPLGERLEDLQVGVRAPGRVAVQPEHAGRRPQLLDHPLQPLRAEPERADLPRAAVRAGGGQRTREAAVVAGQAVKLGVLDEGDRALRALHRAPALAAEDEGRGAAAVQEEDHLLLGLEGAVHGLQQLPAQRQPIAPGQLLSHVHQLHLRRLPANASWQLGHGQGPGARLAVGRDGGRRRPQHESRAGQLDESTRDPCGLVPRRPVLLVGVGALLVQDDESQPRHRGEDRRPAPHDHVHLTTPDPPPLLSPLQLGELAVEDRQRHPEAATEALEELGRERYLGYQHQGAQALCQGLGHGGQVDLGLAARGHAVEERRPLAADDFQGSSLVGGELGPFHPGRPGARVGQQPAEPGLTRGGARPTRPSPANARRQHRAQALDERGPVVGGHHPG